MAIEDKIRLDQLLVKRGFYQTRSRARDAILRACVSLEGRPLTKPGELVQISAPLATKDVAQHYVSRAALKLKHGLDHSKFCPKDALCLDIGASTGGFSQVLLEHGAAHIFALDVGHGQLHQSLGSNARISDLSGLNARDLTAGHLNNLRPDFVVSDVSFISLKLALPAALSLASPDAKGIFLIKPQFEVGRQGLGKGGIVRDEDIGQKAAISVCEWLENKARWQVTMMIGSPIKGSDGNHEYIVAAEKAI